MPLPGKISKPELEQKVENIMINKIQLIVGIIIFMAPVIGFFFKIQLDVALIKENHEAHMQRALEKIAELEEGEKGMLEKIDKDHEAIIRLLQIHDAK